MVKPANLFTPLKLRDLELRNRIIVSPMCQYSAQDGFPSDWHRVHYGGLAVGGAGMVILEATAVLPEGRISWADLGIWDNAHAEALSSIASFIKASGAVPAIQLAHAGRKASDRRPFDEEGWESVSGHTWPVVSATGKPFAEASPLPKALSTDEVKKLPGVFAAAAVRAAKAGFQTVEIHGAHGYLVHQFLSPLCNDRTDEYGGDFGGRSRLLREIVTTVREAVGEAMPLLVRISASDWVSGGITIDDSVRLAEALKGLGVDLVDCSSGGIAPNIPIPAGPGYQVPFAEALKKQVGIAVGTVGLILAPAQADQIIRNGQADAVLLGRELLRDPYWPRRAAVELRQSIIPPAQYHRAW